ncbi:hypothetical protein EB093_07825, partial [bacterium]|nr:hypothetical protein [bacterium]
KLFVTGDASLNNKLYVDKAATLHSTLAVDGVTTLNDKLNVTGDASFNAKLTVGDATALKSTLGVAGVTTLSDKLIVLGDASLNAKLNVGDAATLKSTLAVDGIASMNDKLFVTGDASLNSKLYVKEDAKFDKHIGATDISAGMFQAGRLYFEDNYSGVNHDNLITSTAGDINIRAGPDANGVVHIKSSLIVDGSFTLMGKVTQEDVVLKISEQLDISANSNISDAFTVEQYGTADVATFYNKAVNGSTPVFLVGSNFVSVNKTTHEANYELDVGGNIRASAGLYIGSAVSFNDTLTVTGDYSSTNGNITLTNGKVTTKTLEVTTTSTFDGKATMEAGLDVNNSNIKITSGSLEIDGGFISQMVGEVW